MIRSPCYDQVLTGIFPRDGRNIHDTIYDIRHGERPSRPTNSSQNRWLQNHIWDTITACWSHDPQKRCELSVVYQVFSMHSSYDVLVEFPPVGHRNLVRLAEELLSIIQILPLAPDQLATLITVQKYIFNVISRDGTLRPILSSAEAVAEATTLAKVPFPRSKNSQPPKVSGG